MSLLDRMSSGIVTPSPETEAAPERVPGRQDRDVAKLVGIKTREVASRVPRVSRQEAQQTLDALPRGEQALVHAFIFQQEDIREPIPFVSEPFMVEFDQVESIVGSNGDKLLCQVKGQDKPKELSRQEVAGAYLVSRQDEVRSVLQGDELTVFDAMVARVGNKEVPPNTDEATRTMAASRGIVTREDMQAFVDSRIPASESEVAAEPSADLVYVRQLGVSDVEIAQSENPQTLITRVNEERGKQGQLPVASSNETEIQRAERIIAEARGRVRTEVESVMGDGVLAETGEASAVLQKLGASQEEVGQVVEFMQLVDSGEITPDIAVPVVAQFREGKLGGIKSIMKQRAQTAEQKWQQEAQATPEQRGQMNPEYAPLLALYTDRIPKVLEWVTKRDGEDQIAARNLLGQLTAVRVLLENGQTNGLEVILNLANHALERHGIGFGQGNPKLFADIQQRSHAYYDSIFTALRNGNPDVAESTLKTYAQELVSGNFNLLAEEGGNSLLTNPHLRPVAEQIFGAHPPADMQNLLSRVYPPETVEQLMKLNKEEGLSWAQILLAMAAGLIFVGLKGTTMVARGGGRR